MRASSKPESTTTLVAGEASMIRGNASRPSSDGIERSSRARSGLYMAARSTAWAPSIASATTVNRPLSSSASRSIDRRSWTSSAMRTRKTLFSSLTADSLALAGRSSGVPVYRYCRCLEIRHRVDGRTSHAHLEVQVRTCAQPGAPDVADDLAPCDTLTGRDGDAALVAVEGGQAVAVVDDRGVAVPAEGPSRY